MFTLVLLIPEDPWGRSRHYFNRSNKEEDGDSAASESKETAVVWEKNTLTFSFWRKASQAVMKNKR